MGVMALLMSFWQKKDKKQCFGGKKQHSQGKAGKSGTDWICCHLLMLNNVSAKGGGGAPKWTISVTSRSFPNL